MTEQMIARGEMPHLRRSSSAARARGLRAEPERVPAIVWTTIATGRGPEAHGIQSPRARGGSPGLRTPLRLGAERGPVRRGLGPRHRPAAAHAQRSPRRRCCAA